VKTSRPVYNKNNNYKENWNDIWRVQMQKPQITELKYTSLIKMIILEENFKWHLEAFASELFICIHTNTQCCSEVLMSCSTSLKRDEFRLAVFFFLLLISWEKKWLWQCTLKKNIFKICYNNMFSFVKST